MRSILKFPAVPDSSAAFSTTAFPAFPTAAPIASHAVSLAVFFAVSFTVWIGLPPSPARAALNDTGQTLCYDSAALIVVACDDAHVGDASPDPRQDARFGRDAAQVAGALAKTGGGSAGFDFSKICNDGSDCSAQTAIGINAGEWGCTRDNVTGLTWEMKTMTSASPRDQFRA